MFTFASLDKCEMEDEFKDSREPCDTLAHAFYIFSARKVLRV
jgi:hypothetical protein